MANRLSLQKYFKTRIVPREERDFRVVHYALQSIFILSPPGTSPRCGVAKKSQKTHHQPRFVSPHGVREKEGGGSYAARREKEGGGSYAARRAAHGA
jgi:hypothetical protein